jgi:hypothetical protein
VFTGEICLLLGKPARNCGFPRSRKIFELEVAGNAVIFGNLSRPGAVRRSGPAPRR